MTTSTLPGVKLDFMRLLTNIATVEKRCYCIYHRGALVQELDAQLRTNGRPVRIQERGDGRYLIAIGENGRIGSFPPPVGTFSEQEVVTKLLRAATGD